MKRHLVFRVETSDGTGMYRVDSVGVTEPMNSYGDAPTRHPAPRNDARLGPVWTWLTDRYQHTEWYFGFVSLEQLRSWIYKDEWREALNNIGLYVSLYHAEEIHIGDTQTIFKKNSAIPIGRLDIRTI